MTCFSFNFSEIILGELSIDRFMSEGMTLAAKSEEQEIKLCQRHNHCRDNNLVTEDLS